MAKKKRQKYNPITTLSPLYLEPELEELARRLYEKAHKGSSKYWHKIKDKDSFENDPDLRLNFYKSANQGMREAQDEILSIFKNEHNLSYSKELLLRSTADSIAWTFFGHELYKARLYYQEERQPDLKNCNLDSVIKVAESYIEAHPDAMPLISDLTSFLQVGDLLISCPDTGLLTYEVKEGEMNHKILSVIDECIKAPPEEALKSFVINEGPKAFKQLLRVQRQADRMKYVESVISNDKGVNPDTTKKIKIFEPTINIESWDETLVKTLEESEKKGWAINTFNNCVFIGCYSTPDTVKKGHIAFNYWLDNTGSPDCPRIKLTDTMKTPLALTIFNRHMPEDLKFDILFGRKHVCVGICIEAFMVECLKRKLTVRNASNKEKGRLANSGVYPYTYKNNVIMIGNGKNEMPLTEGIVFRTLYHSQNPISLIINYLSIDS